MSWIYILDRSKKHTRGNVTKESVTISELDRGRYLNYYFAENENGRYYVSAGKPPKDGSVYDRRVFLEKEDDERAITLLKTSLKRDIKKAEQHISTMKDLYNSIRLDSSEPKKEQADIPVSWIVSQQDHEKWSELLSRWEEEHDTAD